MDTYFLLLIDFNIYQWKRGYPASNSFPLAAISHGVHNCLHIFQQDGAFVTDCGNTTGDSQQGLCLSSDVMALALSDAGNRTLHLYHLSHTILELYAMHINPI